ncbi:hypothetical protein Sjap_016725 [Stephania japonica]|uniref:Uncharacterized protein n=1 Tax=Stephania japonica TaxID=461633 RepID=A0AAP0ILJ9_9MAGN
MAQTYEEEVEKEIEVTLTRPEELQQESKDDQSFVLVNPPTLPYIFDDFNMEVDETERLKPFCTADTFVLDDLDITDSYVLEVPDKLPFLNRLAFSKHHSITLAEDMQHTIPNLQNSETQVTAILEHLMDLKELFPQKIFDSEETVNVATLESVEFDEFSIVDKYLSETEETLDAFLHEPDITIAHSTYDEVEKDIKVVLERPEEPQKRARKTNLW